MFTNTLLMCRPHKVIMQASPVNSISGELGNVAKLVERLPIMLESLGSVFNSAIKSDVPVIPSLRRWGQKDQKSKIILDKKVSSR